MSQSKMTKRLQKELSDIQKDPPPGCSAGPDPKKNNIKKWIGTICGPDDTPYAGGIFKLSIEFKDTYPFQAPEAKFITRIFHPNISKTGDICLDILKDQWSPALQISQLLISIASLLETPNADDPLNTQSAKLYKTDRVQYDQTVREYVQNYAQE